MRHDAWPLLSLVIASRVLAINLNISGPDWDYGTEGGLANTTSQACKAAYSADIACDDDLLGLVASMRPAFQVSSTDLDRVCTESCKAALDAYVENVKSACTSKGDFAQEGLWGGRKGFLYDPVSIVGEIFQYTFAQDCRKNSTGQYCYFLPNAHGTGRDVYLGNDLPNIDCEDECRVSFFESARDYPACAKEFNYYYLISRGPDWETYVQEGWPFLSSCGVSAPSPTTTYAFIHTTEFDYMSTTASSDIDPTPYASFDPESLSSQCPSLSPAQCTSYVMSLLEATTATKTSSSTASRGSATSSSNAGHHFNPTSPFVSVMALILSIFLVK